MVTRELLDYIKQELDKGASKEEIESQLLANGWTKADVNEAFSLIAGPALNEMAADRRSIKDLSRTESVKPEQQPPEDKHITIKAPKWFVYPFGFIVGTVLVFLVYLVLFSLLPKTKSIEGKSIVERWGSSIVRIECDDGFGGKGWGSGTLWNIENTFIVTTNKHVIELAPDIKNCMVMVIPLKGGASDIKNALTYKPSRKSFKTLEGEFDLVIFSLEENSSDAPLSKLNDYAHKANTQCNKLIYQPGEKILALGYPWVGTSEGAGLTVNEGIISGLEKEVVSPESEEGRFMWYVTSAKIEGGNSGGAAIAQDGCFMGIPTWSKSGWLESQARLLIFGSEDSFAGLIRGK